MRNTIQNNSGEYSAEENKLDFVLESERERKNRMYDGIMSHSLNLQFECLFREHRYIYIERLRVKNRRIFHRVTFDQGLFFFLAQASTMMMNYEYMDKASIDKDLNCEYCTNPLVEPVSTPCKHTFCRVCIENKIRKTAGACAKPKCKNKSMTIEDLTPVTERIVLNMLDRLLVKCLSCGMTNIQRGFFEKHVTKICPKAVVLCSAADIKCPWTGSSDQLKQHLVSCAYEQLRPVLLEIMHDHRQSKEKLNQMSEQCLKNHQIQMKDLQESNQRLDTSVKELGEVLYQEKSLLKELQNEVQQLRELILQDKSQIHQLQTETEREKAEITRVDERCNRHEIQINQLTDKVNAKGGKHQPSSLPPSRQISLSCRSFRL